MAIEFHRDGPWDLPEGWVWAKAKEFSNIVGGGTPKNADDPSNYATDGMPWITPADLSKYTKPHIERGARSLSDKGLSNCSARIMPAGTLLISSRAPVGYAVVAVTEVCTNQGFKSLVFNMPVIPEFFRYYVIFNRKYFIDNASGTTFKELSGKAMSELLFPVAPLAEQKRIVARVDELFSDIEDGEAELELARKNLDAWRRALLKAAVTGELTREWRKRNTCAEGAVEFLKRIGGHRDGRSAVSVNEQSRSSGKNDSGFDCTMLPESWTWTNLTELVRGTQRNGISIKGSSTPPGVKALRLDALTDDGLDLSAVRYIPLQLNRVSNYAVHKNDFLVSRANGSEALVGRGVYVADIAEEVVFPDTVIRYPLYPSETLGHWVKIAWASPLARAQIRIKAKTTAGILKISQEDIAQVLLPLPPEQEMEQVCKVWSLLELEAKDAEVDISQSNHQVNAIRQSVLKSAFEGKLVEQDPRDEPADVMLARLASSAESPKSRKAKARR